MDFGFNPGLILPVATDVVSLTSHLYASKIANKMAKARLDKYKDKMDMKYNVNMSVGVDYGAYPDFDHGGSYIALDPANDKYLYDPVGIYAQVELTGGFGINKVMNVEITGLKFPDLSNIKFHLPLLKLPFTMSGSMNFSSIYTNIYRYGRK
ncbi:MAG: hypothetical protein JST42_25410 [Bacteroidetes bacterium]|nr:hypothetical protein [Bacteroidota bacterium]